MKKTISVLAMCFFLVFSLTACGDAGSDYLEGNLQFDSTIAGIYASDWERDDAKDNTPYSLYLDGKGKFEALMKEDSTEKVTGQYSIELYPESEWRDDSTVCDDSVEQGVLTLVFDENVYGTKEYEYFVEEYEGDYSVYFYFGGKGAHDDVDAGVCFSIE